MVVVLPSVQCTVTKRCRESGRVLLVVITLKSTRGRRRPRTPIHILLRNHRAVVVVSMMKNLL